MAFAARSQTLKQQFKYPADAFRNQQHNSKQEQSVEEIAQFRKRRDHFRERREHDGTDGRAEDMAAPADDDADEEKQAQVEDEGIRRDVTLQHREQRAGHSGREAAENENGELGAK